MKLNKRIILFISFITLLIVILTLYIIKFNNKSEKLHLNKTIELNFESRVDKLESFDSGEYYKFGWIQVQGTNIDVPILDYRTSSTTLNYSYGWLSGNYKEGENRRVILGHNVLNVSNKPLLPNNELKDFEELMAFSYYNFAKDNLYIQLTLDGKDNVYLIYAISFYDYGYDNAESFINKKTIKNYIKTVKQNSIYDYDIDVNENDEIISVKTCTRYFGVNKKQQFIIEARKLRKNEKTVKYSVKKNNNYKKLNIVDEKM